MKKIYSILILIYPLIPNSKIKHMFQKCIAERVKEEESSQQKGVTNNPPYEYSHFHEKCQFAIDLKNKDKQPGNCIF